MSERYPTSTIASPSNERVLYPRWGAEVPRQLSPIPTASSFEDPYQKQKHQYDPAGFYGSSSPATVNFYSAPPSAPNSERGFNSTPAQFNPNLYTQTGSNYSRLTELKEKGGNKLRRVIKLGGNALARTVSIARNLVPRGNKQPSTPTYEPTPYYPSPGFGNTPNRLYGAQQPVAPSYEQSWNGQPSGYGFNETYQPAPESRIGGSRLRSMFDTVGSVTQNTGNYLSTQFNRLPPEAQTMARGIGRGALNGVLEDYTKTERNGKKGVKYTAVARAAVNPTGAARRAVTHGIRGARQGGMAAFSEVRDQNPHVNTAASLASSAQNIARRFGR